MKYINILLCDGSRLKTGGWKARVERCVLHVQAGRVSRNRNLDIRIKCTGKVRCETPLAKLKACQSKGRLVVELDHEIVPNTKNWFVCVDSRQTDIKSSYQIFKWLMVKYINFRVEVELDHVIELNSKDGYVHVEPGVCIGFLNKFLVRQVCKFMSFVPELDTLTI